MPLRPTENDFSFDPATQVELENKFDAKRPLSSKQDVTITVGTGKYLTIQSALDEIPLNLFHKYTVFIPDGNYASENIKIPAYQTSDPISEEGSAAHLNIVGNGTSPRNVVVGSIYCSAVSGVSEPFIRGLTIDRVTPFANEKYGICLMGTKGAQIYDVAFTTNMGAKIGIGSYESFVKVKNIDVTNLRHAFGVKRGGAILAFETKGSCEYLLESQGGELTVSGTTAVMKRVVEYVGGTLNTVIFDMDAGRQITGYSRARLDLREDARLVLPLDNVENGVCVDLSGYQLDARAKGVSNPISVFDNKNKYWTRFQAGEAATGKYLEVKSSNRLKLLNKFFIKVKVKFNTVGDWAVSKNQDYQVLYKSSNNSWQASFKDTAGTSYVASSQWLGVAVPNVPYTVIGAFFGDRLAVIIKREDTGEQHEASIPVTSGTLIRQTDNPLLINASDGRPDGDTKIRNIAAVDMRELAIFSEIPSYYKTDGINDDYNSENSQMSVSPHNPKMYSPIEFPTSVIGTTSSNPTTTQPPQWLKVVIDGVMKYIPVYN